MRPGTPHRCMTTTTSSWVAASAWLGSLSGGGGGGKYKKKFSIVPEKISHFFLPSLISCVSDRSCHHGIGTDLWPVCVVLRAGGSDRVTVLLAR